MSDEKLSYSIQLYLKVSSGGFLGMVSLCLVELHNIRQTLTCLREEGWH